MIIHKFDKLKTKKKKNIRNFCIEKLKKRNVFFIGDKPLLVCKNDALFKCYYDVFRRNPQNDFDEDRNKKQKEEFGFVYFMVNFQHKLCKIGFSNNPEKRLKEVQTGCPFELTIHKVVKGDIQMERTFHKIYKEYKSNGEWFFIKGELERFLSRDI